MTWIKICGITNLRDGLAAVDAGASAVGFVFFPKSPRNVSVAAVKNIVSALPAEIEKVGVFVASSTVNIDETCQSAGLTAAQIHFTSVPEAPRDYKTKKHLAVPASLLAGHAPDRFLTGNIESIFLDSGNPQTPGGTGKAFDWPQAAPTVRRFEKSCRVVVAGGLNPGNVAEAIRILKPWGVDVSSGVESSPGRKDPQKIRDFIQAVRQVEVSV
jgi:phosphoribosylanthranilate isomerase